MTGDTVPPSYGRRRKSDASNERRRRSGGTGGRRRSDGTTGRRRSDGTTGRRRSDGTTGRRRRSAPTIDLEGVTLSKKAESEMEGTLVPSGYVNPNDKRFAALAANAYHDGRGTTFPSLASAKLEMSNEHGVVYYDKARNEVLWGLHGTEDPADLTQDLKIAIDKAENSKTLKQLQTVFAAFPRVSAALGSAKGSAVAEVSTMALQFVDDYHTKAVLNTYEKIVAKHPNANILVGTHSLGGARIQKLIQRLPPAQEKKLYVHAFNPYSLEDFAPGKHPNYYATRMRDDIVSAGHIGKNVRVVHRKDAANVAEIGDRHSIKNFLGMDFDKEDIRKADVVDPREHKVVRRIIKEIGQSAFDGLLAAMTFHHLGISKSIAAIAGISAAMLRSSLPPKKSLKKKAKTLERKRVRFKDDL